MEYELFIPVLPPRLKGIYPFLFADFFNDLTHLAHSFRVFF